MLLCVMLLPGDDATDVAAVKEEEEEDQNIEVKWHRGLVEFSEVGLCTACVACKGCGHNR